MAAGASVLRPTSSTVLAMRSLIAVKRSLRSPAIAGCGPTG
jgi:hypothetical protein